MAGLTNVQIRSLVKAGVAGMTGDGNGLYLQISKAGGVSWIYRYKVDGKTRYMGLGAFPAVSLANARDAAVDARRLSSRGTDPLDARGAERESRRKAAIALEASKVTFMAAAESYRERMGSAWSAKWYRGWWRKLELYAFPMAGAVPVSEIDTDIVLRILTPIWPIKTRTADEVRGQIEQILDAAKSLGWRGGENPAMWRGHLKHLLSNAEKKKARKREHFSAMDWHELPDLMAKLKKIPSRDAYAARLLILTGCRMHMVRFAKWNEIDVNEKVWSLSGDRMKMKVAFQIPLAEEVVELLQQMRAETDSEFIFPGQGKTGVIHANAIRNLLHELGYKEITRHGFRSTFRDWAGESTDYPREVCEMALAHDERSGTEGAYSRTDYFDKRRSLMSDWALFATNEAGPVKAGDRRGR
ncbi:integrase arm-type DNA-binding domain-containing protein [Pseudomonas lutea]|uniref:Integrase arm-type DNA-binding domain-containing protein n=1 Tax=Pseudomonas lutea TaxID=243924 RepID=A0ABR9AE45_9PSED|nr:site-specific integrase [Pseudomonas lutea]MBD8123845.1 integrase arm-type DNA-binding domain-containing protein [Pseudomonas lutea]